jgi:hypothetical protein
MLNGSGSGMPLWLALFVIAGVLLFLLKISAEDSAAEDKKRWSGSLRLFLAIAMALFTIAGIVHFVVWVRPQ